MLIFCLILYHPGFYSSLSKKKQRNGSISKMFAILVNLANFLPKILSCKSHENKELNRKNIEYKEKYIS